MSADASAVLEFERALARYSVWSKKGQGPAIEDRARKVRFGLYARFRAIAKTAAGLKAEIAARGFKITRRVDPEAELAAAAAGASAPGTRLSVKEEIAARVKSLRYLSVSFLFRSWRAAAGGQSSRFTARNRASARVGEAVVRTTDGRENPFVSLTSLLEGVVEQNERRRMVDAELRAQADDMAEYVARKHREKMQELFKTTYRVALSS